MELEKVPGTTWLLTDDIREEAPLRLFCFPGNEGHPADFAGWSASLDSENVECFYVQLPGRGSRRYETALVEADAVVNALVTEIIRYMDKPFSFYGSEVGSQLSLALALELQARGLPQPRCLLVNNPPLECEHSKDSKGVKMASEPAQSAAAYEDLALLESLRAFVKDKGNGPGLSYPVSDVGIAGDVARWNGLLEDKVELLSFPLSNESGNEALLKAIDTILAEVVVTSRDESISMIDKWNSTTAEYPNTLRLHDMFRESAAKNPDAPAVVYEGKSLTFSEVDALTDCLAGWLYDRGVRVGSAVGIFMEHRAEYALAYIAAHKATGAYLPLELVYPTNLLEGVLRQVEPPVVLTQPSVAGRLPSWQTSLAMDEEGAWIDEVKKAPGVPLNAAQPTPDDLAYIVMSSGTTGAPKGICCPHRGAVHSYHHRLTQFPYENGEREACHVFFVWELLRPLLGGMPSVGGVAVPLYIVPDDHIYDPPKLLQFLEENAITRMLFTPSLLQLVLNESTSEALSRGMKTMKIVWLCGEVVTVELRNMFKRLVPHCHMENLYSISECHDVSYANLDELDIKESPKYAPCGKVIPNVRAYILNDQLEQVPIGVPGRMWIAGPTLAIGYLNMPQRTAERFVTDPFAAAACRHGERMYDTGDRCRYLPSGSIEVIGRCDYMVKVRGYTVVIGAVEAAIIEHPLVSTAVVLTEGEEGSMDKKLVAYVVPSSWEKLPSVSSLQKFLKSRLPPYAVPHVCILLDAVPLNLASGKTDKKRLPKSSDPEVRFAPMKCIHEDGEIDMSAASVVSAIWRDEAEEEAGGEARLSASQRTVAHIWARLLKIDESTINRSSDFFDLGGHSLVLAKLSASIMKDAGVAISIPAIIERPVLSDLADLLEYKMTSEDKPTLVSSGVFTAAQRAVARVWASVLDTDDETDMTAASDFFDLGGHSLLLAKLSTALSNETGVKITIPELLNGSTLGGMALIVQDSWSSTGNSVVPSLGDLGPAADSPPLILQNGIDGVASASVGSTGELTTQASRFDPQLVNLPAEARRLDPSIFPAPTRKTGYSRLRTTKSTRPPQRVLLTGASGFLGAHILASLLRDTTVDVFCLVRAGSEGDALDRLESILNRYNLLDDDDVALSMDRVFPVCGDLSRPLLGLDDGAFKMLAGELDSIIHSGASVNLVRSYQSLKPVNVLGTQEVLRLAVTNAIGTRVKPVHYVSTNGVFPFDANSTEKVFKETADMSATWQDLGDGYGQSKWVAEQMCVQARSRGLPVSVLRPGNLSPSSRTGAWNQSDFIFMLLQGCQHLGCAPNDVPWQIDMTPVDFAARAIVHVTVEKPHRSLGKVLHVQNPGRLCSFKDVIQWLRKATGAEIEGVPLDEFHERLQCASEKHSQEESVLAQLQAGLESFSYYLKDPGFLDCAGMTTALQGSGISCTSVDEDLIRTYGQTLLPGNE